MNPDPFAVARELVVDGDAYVRLRSFVANRPNEPRELILENQMWFSDISAQDDIFEGRPRFRWKEQANLIGDLRALAAKQMSASRPELAEQVAQEFFASLQDPDRLAIAQRNMQEEYAAIYRSSSIACFFRNPLEPRHWHAYADNGRGYGLIFDFTNPWHLEGFTGFGPTDAVPFEVIYVPATERPTIELAIAPHKSNFEDIQHALLTKSDAWQEQREERLIRVGVQPGYVEFPAQSLKALVMGHQIESANRQLLLELVAARELPIAVYQAQPSVEHLALELTPVRV